MTTIGPIQSCSVINCARLRDDNAALERLRSDAAMADAAYQPFDERTAPPGYEPVTDKAALAKLGLNKDLLNPNDSNFRAAVFKHSSDDSYVVAFKGTTAYSLEDWSNNARQAVGNESKYYTRAQEIASHLRSRGTKVRYTGHSLGGGLAAAAASSSGADASLFNPAGLHESTVTNPIDGGRVESVVVRGEILSTIQRGPLPDAEATREWMLDPPAGIGKTALTMLAAGAMGLTLPASVAAAALARSVTLHSMPSIMTGLENRQNEVARAMIANGC